MSDINILFYSNRCEGSKLLISMMQNEQLIRFFHLFCTDNGNVPAHIKLTPTIVLKGNSTFYVAGDAFSWLARVKQWKLSSQMSQIDQEQRSYLTKMGHNLGVDKNQFLGFNEAEMSSMSDIFSFFSKNLGEECDEALPQSYQRMETVDKSTIFAPPLEGGSYCISESNAKLDSKTQREIYQKLQTDRSRQDADIKQAMKQFRNDRH